MDLAPVATTSGTAHDVATALPDDVVYIAVVLDGVSANTANRIVLKLGTAQGIVSSGYAGIYTDSPDDIEGEEATSGFHINASSASDPVSGLIELRRIGDTNKWRASGRGDDGLDFLFTSGTVTLSARLTKLQITLNSISGTNAFDAGQVAVQYSTRKGVGPIANTSDLPEGSSGPYYFTDARARNAISADSGAVVTFNQTTGVINTSATNFNTAADARIGAATISALSDVGTATAAQGDILVRGTAAYGPKGIEDMVKFVEGENATISTAVSDEGVLTATIGATGGGGGGVSLEQVHDAVADDIVGGTGLSKSKNDSANTVTLDLDAATTSTRGGVSVGAGLAVTNAGALSVSMSISGLSNVGSTAPTDGQALAWDNSASEWTPQTISGSGSGGARLADFDAISDSTIVDKSNDGVLMYDGSALSRMGLERFEEEVEPLELKTLELTGYTYKNASLPTGAGAWTISTIASVKYAIFNGKNTDETRQLSKIMTPNFKVRVQGSNASRWFEFVVTAAAATQGGSILGVISDDYIDSSADNQGIPFSAEESCTVTSSGRHLSYGDLEHTIDATRRTQAASAYGIGRFVSAQLAAAKATAQQVAEGQRHQVHHRRASQEHHAVGGRRRRVGRVLLRQRNAHHAGSSASRGPTPRGGSSRSPPRTPTPRRWTGPSARTRSSGSSRMPPTR